MAKIILIDSNDDNLFAAFTNGTDVTVTYANEFITGTAGKFSKQPDFLINCLQKIRVITGETFLQADAAAVTTGPGSFTGIRVGISIAKGISTALRVKIIPVTNFELAFSRIPKGYKHSKFCILLKAKLPEYYFCIMKDGEEIERGCQKIEEIITKLSSDTIIVCNFTDETLRKLEYFEILNVNKFGNELESMIIVAKDKFKSGCLIDSEKVEPLYLKETIYRKT